MPRCAALRKTHLGHNVNRAPFTSPAILATMFGLILLGSAGRASTVGTGKFYCPRCHALQPYEHKKLTRYFTLYFIPIFPVERLGEFIECGVCHTTFDLSVLQPTGPLRLQALIHGLEAELASGHAVQLLVDRLLEAGASREEAAWAVYSAGHGRFAACDQCHTIYKSGLVYCSNCGNKLAPFQGRLE